MVLMGKSSINGPFSMAMLNNQRVNPSNNVQRCYELNIDITRCCLYNLHGISFIWIVDIQLCSISNDCKSDDETSLGML